MIENKYSFATTDSKTIERIISDGNTDINHMILPKGDCIPEHYSNSNVYLIIVQGNISVKLEEQEEHVYPKGTILTIPYKTKMSLYNQHDTILEFFVVKAPSPRNFKNK